MKAVLVLELRGLSEQAGTLARELDHMGITDERVRAATLQVVREAVARTENAYQPELGGEQGADTYYWTFPDVDLGARFASLLLADLWQKAKVHGLYYVKPSLALGWCEPSFSDSRFLDSGSIDVYQAADGGRAYTLYLVGPAIERTTFAFAGAEESARKCDVSVRTLAWQEIVAGTDVDSGAVTISPLLLDSDVIYSDGADLAIEVILSEQAASKEVLVFGGPPSLSEPLYARYVRDSIDLIRRGGTKFAVMSYLPASDPAASLTWLEVCYRLARECPTTFRFGAFPIGDGQLRPFSYQVFEKVRVHVGLRGYDPFRATPTLSSAILLRNPRIAQLFAADFTQSFHTIGQVDSDRHHRLTQSFAQLDVPSRQKMEQTVRRLLT